MSCDGRLIIASNRLPFSIQSDARELTLQPASGGLASALASVHSRSESVWVGWPGNASALDGPQRAQLSSQLDRCRIIPIELSTRELIDYYDGVCNSVLWPVLHYLIDRLPVTMPEFRAYRAVNERFAEALAATHRKGDIIWIHDYHLLLAPAMVRAHIPDAQIGFFLHTPFPAADVFRVLPWRRELLEGMLGSTLVGFQTTRDASNFAEAVRMFTHYGVDKASIVADHRPVRYGAYPIGIDPLRLAAVDTTPGSSAIAVPPPAQHGRRLLVGVDRLDYTKGIQRRLAAFERLLSEEPHLRGSVELLQIAVPSRGHVPSYASFRREVDERVASINGRFGTPDWKPVTYRLESVGPSELGRIYRAADVMLVTSLRDGMNLVAKEFVSSRTDDDGVLILSEMAGASEELTDALVVNPYSVEQLAHAIGTALTMDREERRRRMRSLRQAVDAGPLHHWMERFLDDLAVAGAAPLPAGRQLGELVRQGTSAREPLSFAFVYEEALVDEIGAAERHRPDPELVQLLRELARSGIDLHVISALDHTVLARWFERFPVTLWAEDGLWRRARGERRWQRTQGVKTEWTKDVREFVDHFTARTPGAFVEERSTGLAWHFGRTDRVKGRAQAQALFALLRDAAHAMGFSVAMTHSTIEVRAAGLSRERTVQKLVERDAVGRRLVMFEAASAESSARRAMRRSDLLVSIGRVRTPGELTLPDIRSLRDVLQAALRSPVERATAALAGGPPRTTAPMAEVAATVSP